MTKFGPGQRTQGKIHTFRFHGKTLYKQLQALCQPIFAQREHLVENRQLILHLRKLCSVNSEFSFLGSSRRCRSYITCRFAGAEQQLSPLHDAIPNARNVRTKLNSMIVSGGQSSETRFSRKNCEDLLWTIYSRTTRKRKEEAGKVMV